MHGIKEEEANYNVSDLEWGFSPRKEEAPENNRGVPPSFLSTQ